MLLLRSFTNVRDTHTRARKPVWQEAIARGFGHEIEHAGTDESYFKTFPVKLAAKRDRLASILRDVGLKPIIPQGGYFLVADCSSLGLCFVVFLIFYRIRKKKSFMFKDNNMDCK